VLLALSDDGAPVFDQQNAAALADLGVPAFACTPDAFPELLAVAIDGGDVAAWAHRNQLARRLCGGTRAPRAGWRLAADDEEQQREPEGEQVSRARL
jgi:hypothetical protein